MSVRARKCVEELVAVFSCADTMFRVWKKLTKIWFFLQVEKWALLTYVLVLRFITSIISLSLNLSHSLVVVVVVVVVVVKIAHRY